MAQRYVKLPPMEPIPAGMCPYCRKPSADHPTCSRCDGDGKAWVKRALDRDYGACDLCDGSGVLCPPA